MRTFSPSLMKTATGNLAGPVFYCRDNKRHLVADAAAIADIGMIYPNDVVEVLPNVLDALRPAQRLARRWSPTDTPENSAFMREVAACTLFGTGIEFGALAAPFPVPVYCNVLYADLIPYHELLKTYPNEPAESMVIPTLRTRFEEMDSINDGSLDFIVASHVIEHTINPIGAIVKSYAALRKGGSLVLVIPDRDKTFDRGRKMTTLDHLVSDFENPSHERDKEHHQEFHSIAFPAADFETTWRWSWDTRQPIHFHTWSHESFGGMIEWIKSGPAPFSKIWSHPTLGHDGAIEFYYTLTK